MTQPDTIAILASPGAAGFLQVLGPALASSALPPVWTRVISHPEETPELARRAVELGARRVVAVGGDGTINGIVQGLPLDGSIELGVVPLGTANDFASQLGLVALGPQAALELALTGPSRMMDLGRCNDRVFVNVATVGPASRVTIETSRALKDLIGSAAYLVNGLASLPTVEAFDAVVRGPDASHDGAFLAIYVGNGRCAGGGFAVCPDASFEDGRLDLTAVPERALVDFLPSAIAVALDEPPALDEVSERATGRWFEIVSNLALPVSLDGEPYEASTLRFDVVPDAIRVVAASPTA